jgi:hypothetical protein
MGRERMVAALALFALWVASGAAAGWVVCAVAAAIVAAVCASETVSAVSAAGRGDESSCPPAWSASGPDRTAD